MNADNISRLLTAIGCRSLRVTGPKVLATCPFEHEHSSGRDNSPSFVVFVANSGESAWNCSYPHVNESYSKGNMQMLVQLHAEARGLPVTTVSWGDWGEEGPSLNGLYRYVWTHDCSSRMPSPEKVRLDGTDWSPIRRLPSLAGRYVHADKLPALEAPALPRDYMERYEDLPHEAMAYLRGPERGLDHCTIDFWGLKYDRRDGRIMIPIYDLKGRLIATSGRSLDPNVEPKYRHMTGFKRRFHLFGEDPKSRAPLPGPKPRGIVVEGQFDVIRLWQLGYRGAVAMYGADMNAHQIGRFKSLFSSAVFITDGDVAGANAGEKLARQFEAASIPLDVLSSPKGKGMDPGNPKFTLAQIKLLLGEPEVDNDW